MNFPKGSIGKTIQSARLSKHLTQQQLAEIVDVTPRYIQRLESEINTPSVALLYKLALVLGFSIDQMLFPTPNEQDELRHLVNHRLKQCDTYELRVVLATLEAMLDQQVEEL